MQTLTKDIVHYVLALILDSKSLLYFSMTCKKYSKIIRNPRFWQLKLQRDYGYTGSEKDLEFQTIYKRVSGDKENFLYGVIHEQRIELVKLAVSLISFKKSYIFSKSMELAIKKKNKEIVNILINNHSFDNGWKWHFVIMPDNVNIRKYEDMFQYVEERIRVKNQHVKGPYL